MTNIPGVADMFAGYTGWGGGGGGGGGGYISASSSASSGPVGYSPQYGGFGGIQTGGSQGVDITTLALVAGAVLLGLYLLR